MRRGALLALALVVAVGLTACGGIVGAGNAGNVEVAEGGDASGELVISNWPGLRRPGRQQLDREVHRAHRDRRRVHRGHQRQRGVLRQGPAPARAGRVGRPQHLRRHRLDGEADVRPRLPLQARPRRPADGVREHPAGHPQHRARPRPRLRDPLAERDDRDLGRQVRGPRRDLDQRPLRPQVQGPRDDDDRDARHRPAGDEGRRHRSRRRRPPRNGWRRSRRSARRRTRGRSGASPATTTPRTSPAATRSRRSAGRATAT